MTRAQKAHRLIELQSREDILHFKCGAEFGWGKM